MRLQRVIFIQIIIFLDSIQFAKFLQKFAIKKLTLMGKLSRSLSALKTKSAVKKRYLFPPHFLALSCFDVYVALRF
ncbi:hypothetical protein DPV96_09350 [Aggregatibacter segnis]|nr:hypothetical protein DPV96_09350 [Aggregatibacter segnis]